MGRTRHSMDILPPLSKCCGLASVGRACDPAVSAYALWTISVLRWESAWCPGVSLAVMRTKELLALSPHPWSVGENGTDGTDLLQEERIGNREGECWRHRSLVLESGMHHIPVTGLMGVIMNVFVFSSSDVTQKSFSDIKREPRISTFSQMLSFLTPLGWTNCHSALSPQRSKFWWLLADFYTSPLIYL